MEYPIHPYCKLFPEMKGKDYLDLKKSIADLGLQDPIKLFDGQIIDGRNRQKACDALGIEPEYYEIITESPVEYVIAMNLARRHLSTQQRAAIAAELANMVEGGKEANAKATVQNCTVGEAASPPISIQDAADIMNVSRRSVATAKKVMKEDPELHEAIKEGKIVATTGKKKPITKTSTTTKKFNTGYSWQTIAIDLGLISGASGGGRQACKKELSALDSDSKLFDEDHQKQLKTACIKLLRNRDPSLAKKSDAAIVKLRGKFSKSQENAYEKALRLAMRNIDIYIQEQVEAKLDEVLPVYHESNEKYKQVVNRYRGIFKWAEYKKLLSCLHSDRLSEFLQSDPNLAKRFNDSFNLIKQSETVLCGTKEKLSGTLPKSVAEMEAMKAEVQRKRKAKRAAK